LIEIEFSELERFKDRNDFMQKALTYQVFFNFQRPNSYKENKTPWQLVKEKRPDLPPEALLLLPDERQLELPVTTIRIAGFQ
jgi:hypothetical protein